MTDSSGCDTLGAAYGSTFLNLYATMPKCPHCGNTDPKTIEANRLPPTDPDYTLLCTRRVRPEDSSFDPEYIYPEFYDDEGMVACGMQWTPNQP